MKTFTQIFLVAPLALLLTAPMTGCKQDESAPTKAEATKMEKARAEPAPRKCGDCGTVTNIEQLQKKGEASGVGLVAGAVLGGVLGHQVGGGRGQDVATVAGAVGGAVAGNEIEKQSKASTYYRVTVSMDTGGTRVIDVNALNGLATGTKVKVVGNNLELAGR